MDRVGRARELMKASNLDCLMVTGDWSASPNYRYLSGHLPRDYQANFARPHIMLLTPSGDAGLVVFYLSKGNAEETSWVEQVWEYTQPFSHQAVVDAFKSMGLRKGRVGAELGLDQRLLKPVAEFERIKESLPQLQFVDAADLLWELRIIKSQAEIECIKEADRINGKALEVALTQIQVGTTEVDIAKRVAITMVEEGAYRPPYAQLLIASSPKYKSQGHRGRLLGPSTEPLGKGDIVFVDSGCVVNGYWGEFNRMAVVGEPSQRQRKFHDMIRTIVQTTIAEAIKPGATGRQVMEFMVSMYKKFDLEESQYARYLAYPYSHLCHGIGLASSEPPLVRIDNDEPLRPGTCLSVEAYVQDDVTYGSEEDVWITQQGCEVLSDPDTGLYINAVG